MKRFFINRFGVTLTAPILSISRLCVRVFTHSPLKSRLNPINYMVRISIVILLLITVFTVCYFLSLVLGLDLSLIWVKLKSMLLLRLFRFLFFRLLGWEVPLILLCLVSGLGGSTLHMQDPAGGQPAANPAAEQPSNVPSSASTSGWRSFEERVLLEPMPSSGESSEASVNQQPVIPELELPLLDENTRREDRDRYR